MAFKHLMAAVVLLVWAVEPSKDPEVDKLRDSGNVDEIAMQPSWFGQLIETIKSPQWIPIVLLGTVVAAFRPVGGWGPFEHAIAFESGFTEDNLFILLVPVFAIQAIASGYFKRALALVPQHRQVAPSKVFMPQRYW